MSEHTMQKEPELFKLTLKKDSLYELLTQIGVSNLDDVEFMVDANGNASFDLKTKTGIAINTFDFKYEVDSIIDDIHQEQMKYSPTGKKYKMLEKRSRELFALVALYEQIMDVLGEEENVEDEKGKSN